MILWIDAQLPPLLAKFLEQEFGVEAFALRDIGLRDACDCDIYEKAKQSDATIVSKDSDFVDLIQRLGTPPKLLWVTCGNVSNANLRQVFGDIFADARALLECGEPIVEIGDK